MEEGMCVKEKGLEEKMSFSPNEENPSQKPSADGPCCLVGQDWVPVLPQDEDKGRQDCHGWLTPTNIHSLGLACCSRPLSHTKKKNWVLLARRKGNEAVTMSLLRGFGGLLNGCPVSPFMIQRTTWTHKSAKEHRAPEDL